MRGSVMARHIPPSGHSNNLTGGSWLQLVNSGMLIDVRTAFGQLPQALRQSGRTAHLHGAPIAATTPSGGPAQHTAQAATAATTSALPRG
jgi:hypothetical protein